MIYTRKISKILKNLHLPKKISKVSSQDSSLLSSRTAKMPSDMNVAMICDEFTWNSFRFEFHAYEITPDNWREVFLNNHIDLFFCESAWSGIDSINRPWRGQIYASINFKDENRKVLLEILDYCNKHKIPTAFWNKEDPTHYGDRIHDFVATAKLFDHIFTTAEECIERYKKEYGLKNVHLMMFATQPKLFNPISTIERTDEIIFAGSWYRQHAIRTQEMGKIFDLILASSYSLKIYNRHSHNSDPNHAFPEKYFPYIHERLDHDQMDCAYKGSKFALNINTVTDSETMFSRRVFELMSSNTLVISNRSNGMKRFFGELVVFTDGEGPLVIENEEEKRREALYLVLKYHTYEKRFKEMLQAMKIPYLIEHHSVSLIYRISNMDEAEKSFIHFLGVDWSDKKAVFWVSRDTTEDELRKIVEKYNFNTVQVRSEHFHEEYEAVYSPDTPYYIWADISLPKDFINNAMCHYSYLDKKTSIAISDDKYQFRIIDNRINVLSPSICWKNNDNNYVYTI